MRTPPNTRHDKGVPLQRRFRRGVVAASLLAAIGTFPAVTLAEDVLPLRHGIYIDESQSCLDPANAGLRNYDGNGINSAHTHSCHLTVQKKEGTSYVSSQECVDAGVGPGPVVTEKMNISVINSGKFILKQGASTTTFEYCSPLTLPPGLTPPA